MGCAAQFWIKYLKKQNAMKVGFSHIPVIKNTIKRIVFKNAYESDIIYQSFLYASIPAESSCYAHIFFPFYLMSSVKEQL